jgi:hypothetical protein
MRRLRQRVPERTLDFATFLGAGRIAFGAAMVLGPRPFLVAMRTPADQITPSSKLLTRMAGMRDVLLGIHVLRSRDERESLRNAALLNTAADTGDAVFLAASARWPGFFTAGASGVPVAASAAISFYLLARSLD